ncbi:MAG: prolyl oligopeptidase family serine peptidase [Gemmatimonadetes bacterium]|nr:S9 family peptidase [Gemmatimonadota bacterium]NNM04483.1 prolyl oligopeptidase family serine peptidase [Gemmatimonadota bacterium]
MAFRRLWTNSLRFLGLFLMVGMPSLLGAQGTIQDYERADSFSARTRGLVIDLAEAPSWIDGSSRFWYRKSVEGGNRFVLVDASVPERGPAFDHDRLAGSLSSARGDTLSGVTLPFSRFEYGDGGDVIRFTLSDSTWECGLSDYACENQGPVPAREERRGRGGSSVGYQAGPGQLWRNNTSDPVASPNGDWEAFIQNHNVAVRKVGEEEYTPLSSDGSEGNVYTRRSISWSPDSKKLAVYRVIPGHQRQVHYVESSPDNQLQPLHSTLTYAKPGDVLDKEHPVVFDIEAGRQVDIDDSLSSNAYTLSRLVWREDSRRLTFEYNQRGHRVYRIIEIDAATGETRSVISEEPETFFEYSGKKFREDIGDGEEIVWMSERDGWNHLYLYDGVTGQVKNQITRGEWVVRGVDRVDEENRQIWFRASGMNSGQDPYFVHYYRINFDGSGLIALTEADGTHTVSYSPDRDFYVDRWSRVDHPPVAELRRVSDRRLVMELERADASALLATGWQYPEVFTAKGRDGETDIWGMIVRPTNYDPARRYPVIEYIYAGPHSSHVPKSFSSQRGMQATAELGFIVAQIDGMGTSNRSKAFHDVSWKNIADAGFPDRILWHQSVAASHDDYDITNVGIYGNSAGGQNAMAALLFHPEFYKVSVSTSGCHDNRMDKIWWNELWMSWPLGPHYDASSNVVNAHRLQGKLFLLVPEMDTNVDPASTMQVVDALIRAGKDFDFMVVPGANHGSGGSFGVRKRYDFFVRHILGKEPPSWNQVGLGG